MVDQQELQPGQPSDATIRDVGPLIQLLIAEYNARLNSVRAGRYEAGIAFRHEPWTGAGSLFEDDLASGTVSLQ